MATEEFDPVADYRRGMVAEMQGCLDKIIEIEARTEFSPDYKEGAIGQLTASIANWKDAVAGFDKMISSIRKGS
jgi:hypothetical protein